MGVRGELKRIRYIRQKDSKNINKRLAFFSYFIYKDGLAIMKLLSTTTFSD